MKKENLQVLTTEELECINGGSWGQAFKGFVSVLGIAASPVIVAGGAAFGQPEVVVGGITLGGASLQQFGSLFQ